MNTISQQIRACIKRAVMLSGGGHAGGSLSAADILACLYGGVLTYDPQNPEWELRDRLILSKGHSGLGLYAALAVSGYFPTADLDTFGMADGYLMNHPDAHVIPGVEVSTGSLGHGLPIACGMALAAQKKGKTHVTFCILGDGECQEGSVWEAAMFANHYELKRLIVVVDRNRIGNDGPVDKIVTLEPFIDKWRAFGFAVYEEDGHDIPALEKRFRQLKEEADGPYVVVANTIKGKGLIPEIAGTGASHYLKGSSETIASMFLTGKEGETVDL